MTALLLEAQASRLRITVYALITLAVTGGIGAAAVKADHEMKRQDLAMQEAAATWVK